ncbi:hypothetical protein FIBSPDRAFT_955118 [Athelia psychrophila]|uniref:Uncharacterized protein n=1 Tax=Athelia psychrophila TaxID=1759441 RepID=A0A166II75_9AGAM|nr:hypothetical protein FIBSPDRAFT_955118 [Fibularhizoctonia sp. CBS 109695]
MDNRNAVVNALMAAAAATNLSTLNSLYGGVNGTTEPIYYPYADESGLDDTITTLHFLVPGANLSLDIADQLNEKLEGTTIPADNDSNATVNSFMSTVALPTMFADYPSTPPPPPPPPSLPGCVYTLTPTRENPGPDYQFEGTEDPVILSDDPALFDPDHPIETSAQWMVIILFRLEICRLAYESAHLELGCHLSEEEEEEEEEEAAPEEVGKKNKKSKRGSIRWVEATDGSSKKETIKSDFLDDDEEHWVWKNVILKDDEETIKSDFLDDEERWVWKNVILKDDEETIKSYFLDDEEEHWVWKNVIHKDDELLTEPIVRHLSPESMATQTTLTSQTNVPLEQTDLRTFCCENVIITSPNSELPPIVDTTALGKIFSDPLYP